MVSEASSSKRHIHVNYIRMANQVVSAGVETTTQRLTESVREAQGLEKDSNEESKSVHLGVAIVKRGVLENYETGWTSPAACSCCCAELAGMMTELR